VSEQHLAPAAIEAMVHERFDLVSPSDRSHASKCAVCAAAIETARTTSLATHAALQRVSAPAIDLDRMVARALGATPAVSAIRQPSRRSFVFAAAAGIIVAVASALPRGVSLASVASLASIADAPSTARTAATFGNAVSRVIAMKVPLGWAGLGFVALAVLAVLTLGFRSVLLGARWTRVEEASR
jgi:hypothetical protein